MFAFPRFTFEVGHLSRSLWKVFGHWAWFQTFTFSNRSGNKQWFPPPVESSTFFFSIACGPPGRSMEYPLSPLIIYRWKRVTPLRQFQQIGVDFRPRHRTATPPVGTRIWKRFATPTPRNVYPCRATLVNMYCAASIKHRACNNESYSFRCRGRPGKIKVFFTGGGSCY